jgi:spore coat polysaccharide biosynthesis protein SpsF
MMKTLAILQARTSSNRLPGKVLKEINGKPMIYWQIMRTLQAKKIGKLIVATSTDSSDDSLADFLANLDFEFYRGSLPNVLSRFEAIGDLYGANNIVRLTADCPLVMPEVVDLVIQKYLDSSIDYVSNTLKRTFADGLDVEVFSRLALSKLSSFDLSEAEKEHVTLGIYSRPQDFSLLNVSNDRDEGTLRWTVDYQSDFDFVKDIYENFKTKELEFGLDDVRKYLASQPTQDTNGICLLENSASERQDNV